MGAVGWGGGGGGGGHTHNYMITVPFSSYKIHVPC